MSMNPFSWSANWRAVGQLVTLVITIVSSVGGLAVYVGGGVWHVAEQQTTISQQLQRVQSELIDAKAALVAQDGAREKAIGALKSDVAPRIEDLEKSVNSVKADAAATKQRVDDMREDLLAIKGITTRTLSFTQSHDDDIRATREAVAPKRGDRSAVP